MKRRKCILGGSYNAKAWLDARDCVGWKGLSSKNSLLSHRLSLQVNGSEDYKIPVQWLVIGFLERDGQIKGRSPTSWDITRHPKFLSVETTVVD